jgi:hypothetical protein
MNYSSLSKLSPSELRIVGKKNLFLFGALTLVNLVIFYYSLYHDHWISVFLALGYFIVGLSFYDNYETVKSLAGEDSDFNSAPKL